MFTEKDFAQSKPDDKKLNNELNKLEHKSKSKKKNVNIKKKVISEILYKLKQEENNSYLDIMLNDLAFYKNEKNESFSRNLKKEDNQSPESFVFNFLEKYLMELCYSTDQEKREEKIRKIYEWYKEKKQYGKDIKTINYKSYIDKDVIDEKDFSLKKKELIFKTTDMEKNHRNLELINKKILDEYERKKMSKPFWALKKAISSQTISSQRSNTIITSTKIEKPDFTSLYSSTKGTNIPTKKNYFNDISSYIDKPEGGLLEKDYIHSNPDNIAENIFLPPVNRETKFSYSYLRPMYDLNDIYMENRIINEKNKQLSLKRSQEEIKEKLKEFSLFRAKFKENLNNKFEMKNLLNIYVNQNNLSSFLLKKYRIEETEKDKKEDIEPKSISELKESESNDINKKKKSSNLNLSIRFQSEKTLKNKLSDDNIKYSNENYFKSESSEKIDESKGDRSKSYQKDINASLTQKVSLFEFDEEKNKEQEDNSNKLGKSARFTLSKKFSLRKRKKTTIRKKSMLSNLFTLKLFSGQNEKIKTNQIQNIEMDSKILKSSQIQNTKEFKIKFPQEKLDSELLNKNKKENNSDALPKILANDILSKEKMVYQNICKITTNPTNYNYLESDINQRTKMMMLNKNKDEINKQLLIKIKKRNHFEKLNKRYNTYKHNLLSMRQSLSKEKRQDYQTLIDKINLKKLDDYEFYDENENELTEIDNRKKNHFLNYKFQKKSEQNNFSLLRALVNPRDNSNYLRFFLPRHGSLLLSRDKPKKFL